MKLLQEFDNQVEGKAFASALLQKGIATHLAGAYSSNYRIATGTTKVGVWIVLDDQFEDAIKLLSNPNHQVQNRLPDTEIEKFKQALEGQLPLLQINNKAKNKILTGIVLLTVVAFALVMVLK